MTTNREHAALIMAAGKSTRMKSRIPKAAHKMWGRTIGRHVIEACKGAGITRIIVVVGHQADLIRQAMGDGVEYVLQEQQLGTGHAVICAQDLLKDFDGTLLVLPADTPLITSDSLKCLLESCPEGVSASLLTAILDDAAMYGRIVRNGDGSQVTKIVEAKDAGEEILAIREICTSIYAFNCRQLFEALSKITPENRQKEYYLTDVIGIFASEGRQVKAAIAQDAAEALGINTRYEMAIAADAMRKRILKQMMLDGVTMIDPDSVYADCTVAVGADTIIYPQTILEGATEVGEQCILGPQTRITDSQILDEAVVEYSVVDSSTVGAGARVGPFARLRPGSQIGSGARIGDFVEIKNSRIGDDTAVAHMTYIGDAEVGQHVNIGAGTITCNYDGKRKHKTVIGNNAFIGSHSTLNAPVSIGDGAFIASGTVVGKDVPEDALAIARPELQVKEGWAKRRREASQAEK